MYQDESYSYYDVATQENILRTYFIVLRLPVEEKEAAIARMKKRVAKKLNPSPRYYGNGKRKEYDENGNLISVSNVVMEEKENVL